MRNRRRVVYYAILLLLILGDLLGELNYIIIIFPEYDKPTLLSFTVLYVYLLVYHGIARLPLLLTDYLVVHTLSHPLALDYPLLSILYLLTLFLLLPLLLHHFFSLTF